MKKVVILFGGQSAEHEVSVITGLQVIEEIDRTKFLVYPIKLTSEGVFKYYPNLLWKKDYLKTKPKTIFFGKDAKGVFFKTDRVLSIKYYIDIAYLAFHGGKGESGQIQGMFETLGLPFTSSNTEGSVISMNKVLTKEVLDFNNIKTVTWFRAFSKEIRKDSNKVVKEIKNRLSLPVIIKPSHLGSSIGINIAKSRIDLKKHLLVAAQIDSEVLIEKYLSRSTEFNISVREIKGKLELSEIERPISKDEILSFADKYERGGKKVGGMASLSRELPAKISKRLKIEIERVATKVYEIVRAKGMIRIDFMLSNGKLYVTEVNPIPGSMSFYLWEASGIPFTDQITELLNQAELSNKEINSQIIKHESDIVEKFIKGS